MITEEQFLEPLQYVVRKSDFVKINNKSINKYVRNFSPAKTCHWSKIYPLKYQRREKDDEGTRFLFLIENLAFCFWGYPKKWTMSYEGKKLDGWWALVASCERALENGMPLLKERKKILNQIGETLINKYDGRFHIFYQEQTKEAFSLIKKIAEEFYGFNDMALYHGTKVLFYKKAQVVLTDINEIFKRGYGAIKNIEKLPGHDDYKIPAVMQKLSISEYNSELSKMIDNRIKIPVGSETEIEIRANMLWATHLICEKLKPKHPIINPSLLCGILWGESQTRSKDDN